MLDWLFNWLARKSRKLLEQEIEQRKECERLLQLERDNLEATVAQRTQELMEVNMLLREQMQARQAVTDELATQATDMTALQKATVQTCAILDALMQLAPVGMVFFDTKGRYIKINNWLAKINNRRPEEHIGRTVDEVVPAVANQIKPRLQSVATINVPILDDEVHATMPDNKEHIFLTSYYPVYTPDNVRLGIGVVVKEVTEQKKMEAELRRRVTEVTDSDRQKTEFLAMLAHELRNPLSPIMNSVYLLSSLNGRNGDDDPHAADRRNAHQVIGRQVQHMSRLLDDLLDIARINRGKIKLRKEPVDVNKLLKRVFDLHKSAAETRRHTMTFHLAPQSLTVNGDPTRLEQVFGNILSNAIKYTENDGKGRIEIKSFVCVDNWVVASIRDNGIGINAATLPKLFEIFAQASRSLDRSQGGLGIGLALAQDLVRMHGGVIEARSDGTGRGSEFIVRLPLMQVHSHKTTDNEENYDSLPHAIKPLRILVVDDNVDAAESLSILLHHSGHETQMVYDGATALKKVNVYNPDAILLDIGLPGLDGYTCCELLRESHYNGLVVAITGYGADTDRQRSTEAGFNFHLTKPVNPVELAQILNQYAESQKDVS